MEKTRLKKLRKKAPLFLALLLAGCNGEVIKAGLDYREICIDGVVYISTNHGITPKINADFYPYTCTKAGTVTEIPQ